MRKMMLAASAIGLVACAGGSSRPDVAMVQDPRCAAVADTVSKYVSEDALPSARLIGDESLRPPPVVHPGDTVEVEFVVLPNGLADTASVQVNGVSDPGFVRSAIRFAAVNRFVPAQVSGCNVVSRYSVVMRPR